MIGRLGRRKLTDEVLARIPEMSKDQLLVCFKVDPGTPLLVGVIHVLKGLEEIAKENVSTPRQDSHEKAHYGGAIAALAEAQERLSDIVERANKTARGEKE